MDLMKGKKGIIFGVSNTSGIAYGIAKELFDAGADIAFTYANAAMEKRVRPIAESMNSKLIMECDVTDEDKLKEVFENYEKTYGDLDFVIHAVAFANREDLTGEFVNTSKAGWDLALGVSAYSLVAISRCARPYMKNGGSIFSLTFWVRKKLLPIITLWVLQKLLLKLQQDTLQITSAKIISELMRFLQALLKLLQQKVLADLIKCLKPLFLRLR